MNSDTTYAPPEDLDARSAIAQKAGAVGLVICAFGYGFAPDHFFRSWLIAYLLFLGIALGSMGLLMVQHLSGGAWGVFRRVFEASSRTLPLMAVLFLPIVFGMTSLYPWSHPDLVEHDEVLLHKAAYLNSVFFLIRALVYFVGWTLIAWTLSRWSRQQDEGDTSVNLKLRYLSGGGIVFYTLAATFASVDWVMSLNPTKGFLVQLAPVASVDWVLSLNPHWYSTLFGFLFVGGQGLSALAFTIIVSTFLDRRAPMASLVKPSHFHDLGKLSLAFVMLWAYFNFSQYMLIYAADLVEEIPYFLARINIVPAPWAGWSYHGWQYMAKFLVIFYFVVPFSLLLSRDNKRMPHRLVWVALTILVVRYIDLIMLVSPEFDAAGTNLHMAVAGEQEGGFYLHWLDLAAPLAVGGLWLWMFFTQLAQRPLLAFRDPYLRESLETTGGR